MSMFDINRLLRSTGWNADDLAQEVYAILDTAATRGIEGPLRINTTGSNPAIVFAPQTTTQGTPFQVQNGGSSYNYTFGPQTGSNSGPVFYTGGNTEYGNVTYGGNSYTFQGGPGNSNSTVINFGDTNVTPATFTPTPPGGGGWGGGGGTGGGGGGFSINWPPLTDTLGDGGSGGVQVAVGQIAGGSGSKYQVDVKGFNGNSFTSDAVALGLGDGDTLDAGTWHVVVAYVTGDQAEVFIVPAVFHSGSGKGN